MADDQSIGQALQRLRDQAREHENAGAYQAAFMLHKAILELRPDDADAHYGAGHAAVRQNDLDRGVVHLFKAWQLAPKRAQHWTALILALGQAGRAAEARKLLRKARESGLPTEQVRDIEARLGLMDSLKDAAGENAPAASSPAASNKGKNSAAKHSGRKSSNKDRRQLARLFDQGQLAEAEALAGRMIRECPDDPFPPKSLGAILSRAGRFQEAVASLRAALELNPKAADTWNTLGRVLLALGKPDEALLAYDQALRNQPEYPLALSNRGNALRKLDRLQDAIDSFNAALQLQPDYAEALSNLALAYRDLGEREQAMECLERALELQPGLKEIRFNYAGTLKETGNIQAAVQELEKLLADYPDEPTAYFGLLAHRAFPPNHPIVPKLQAMLDAPEHPLEERVRAGFSLGKIHLDAGRDQEAFDYYRRANERVARVRPDLENMDHKVEELIATFSPDYFSDRAGWGVQSDGAVLITGMPRAGKSLLEQWLGTWPEVVPRGETQHLIEALRRGAGKSTWVDFASAMTEDQASATGRAYLDALAAGQSGGQHFIDTLPGNLWHLGFLGVCLPQVPVILCRRDERDLALACYFKHFREGHGYAYSLDKALRRIRASNRIMAHWATVLPNPLLSVDYEDLVCQPEDTLARVCQFLGLPEASGELPWSRCEGGEAAHLGPGDSLEVPMPPRQDMVGFWRRFEDFLRPHL